MQSSRNNRSQPYQQNNAYYPRQTGQDYQENYGKRYEKPNAFLSSLLYVLAVISICAFIGLLAFRSAGVGHVIRSANIYHMLEQMTDEEHSYYIVNQVNGLHFHNQEVDLYELSNFLQRESVSDEIGAIVDGYANAFLLGNLDHHVTTEDIARIARNLEPDFTEFFDYKMTEADIEHMAQSLDDVLDFDSLSVGGLMEDFNVDLTAPLILVSPFLLWTVGILCILLLVTIYVIRKAAPAEGLLAVGITLTISGFTTIAGSLIMSLYAESVRSDIYVFSISAYLSYLSRLVMQIGLVFAAIGAILITGSMIYRKMSQNNQRRAGPRRA